MTFTETLRLIRSDYERTAELWGDRLTLLNIIRLFFTPGIATLTLFRTSHWIYGTPLRPLAWPIWAFNITLTGADILPYSQIGQRAFIGHTVGVAIGGVIGDDVTIFGRAGIGGGVTDPLTGERSLTTIGNNVQLGYNVTILGPWEIGDNVVVTPCSYVNSSIPSNHIAFGIPAKHRLRTGDEDVVAESKS